MSVIVHPIHLSNNVLLHAWWVSFRAYISKNSTHYPFARLGLPHTIVMPKHSEGVLRAQNKSPFWTQHRWKPIYRLFVWPYLWILNFLTGFHRFSKIDKYINQNRIHTFRIFKVSIRSGPFGYRHTHFYLSAIILH